MVLEYCTFLQLIENHISAFQRLGKHMAWQNDTEKKPGKPISNYFDFKYAVNIYIDSQ